MATVRQCEVALRDLAAMLDGVDEHHRRRHDLERTVTCRIRDLDVVFAGRLRDGRLYDICQVDRVQAQIRLAMNSDDLIGLTSGQLEFAAAWASGRIRVDASIFDLLRLRALF
jgi:hypothetical protein